MRTLLRRLGVLCLAAALGCSEADIVHEGEHVTLVVDPAVEACGDMVGHMDRFVATLAGYLGVSLAEEHFDFIWYSEERFTAEANCGYYGDWCTDGAVIRSTVAPLDQALARLIMGRLGAPPPFFLEGAMVAFASESYYVYGSGYPGYGDVQQTLAVGAVDPALGGAFTRFLIDRHGLAAYLAFYARVRERDYLPEIEAVHAAQFGESMTETILAFDDAGRWCPAERFRLKLLECSAPAIAWDDDSLLLRRSLACGGDVVGPFADGLLQELSTLEVTTAGNFALSLAGDDPAGAWLAGCGGCEDEATVSLAVGREPARVWLPAGRYYLKLAAYADRATSVALRIERVDEP